MRRRRASAGFLAPAPSRLGGTGFPSLLEVIRGDRPDGQVGIQCQGLGEVLGRGVGQARLELAHGQVEFPGGLLAHVRGERQEGIGRLHGFAADRESVPAARSWLVRLHPDPGDRPLPPERVGRQIVAQQHVDQPLPVRGGPGLRAEVGILDRAQAEQVQRLVRLPGAAIEVHELGLDDHACSRRCARLRRTC